MAVIRPYGIVSNRIGQPKIKGKLKAATATIPSTQSDKITKQLKQQQIDTLVGKMKTLVTTLQSAQAPTSFRQGNPSFGMKGRGRNPYTDRRGDPGGRGLPSQSRLRGSPFHRDLPLSLDYCILNRSRGCKTYRQSVFAVWGSGTPKKELSHAKSQGAFSRGE